MVTTKTKAAKPVAAGMLFETSWEVCNKIGGIYTVLSTKAEELARIYGSNLVFVGPDVWTKETPSPSFIERKTLLKNISSKLELPYGLKIRVGRWDIPGQPIAVLVDFRTLDAEMDSVFGEMWNAYGVDSLHANGDYREGCTFAVASAIVMKAIAEYLGQNKVTAHFNEWTTGMGLLWLQQHLPSAVTLFTTHATSIGRSICSNGKPLYDYFEGYNGDQMAGELNMESKHSVEKAAAHAADCFTAVSELTALECEQLLDIRPQVVTPNGFNASMVPSAKEYNTQRKEGRSRILAIATALSGYEYRDEETFIVATSGRNEYRNKGLDLYIDSMLEAGERYTPGKKIIALVMVPAWVREPSSALLENLATSSNGAVWPGWSTHRLNNEDSDPVWRRLADVAGRASTGDVTFIYMPVYLDGHDGVLDISYYKFLPALDASVFASYYEPWGYTPLESVAFGVPTVTSDKSGFGQWILGGFKAGAFTCGVDVVGRTDSNYAEAADKIAQCVHTLAEADSKMIQKARKSARTTAGKASWSLFIKYYEEAFEVARHRASERNEK